MDKTVLIEHTSKALKKQMLVGGCVALAGILLIGLLLPLGYSGIVIGSLTFAAGMYMLIAAKIKAWWHHG